MFYHTVVGTWQTEISNFKFRNSDTIFKYRNLKVIINEYNAKLFLLHDFCILLLFFALLTFVAYLIKQ